MRDRAVIGQEVRDHFERKWQAGDPWDLARSDFELAKYRRQLELLGGRRFERGLEIGCANGVFTRMLASSVDRMTALDISPTAIEMARAGGDAEGRIDFRVANVMDLELGAEGPWDLVVFSETIPYIGWLYPMFNVVWVAHDLFNSMRTSGRLLMCNTCMESDSLLHPRMLTTYRDMFRNVGFDLEVESVFHGVKDDTEIDSVICVFHKPADLNTTRKYQPRQ
jgi:SAM-dependent methyltransferase